MKKLIKILKTVLWLLLISGVVILLGFINAEQSDRPVTKICINIGYGGADVLMTVADVDSLFRKNKFDLKGMALGSVNTKSIANLLRRQAYVSDVNVYETNEGYLNIDILQREPVLRIVNQDQEGFYIDRGGNPLPLNPDYPAHVLVANGFIKDSFIKNPKLHISMSTIGAGTDSLLTGLYKLSVFLTDEPYFRTVFDQVYVNERHELELIPRKGNHVVLLGDTQELKEKMNKLFIFYTQGLNKIGWNNYQVINIKYKNQVVCSKL